MGAASGAGPVGPHSELGRREVLRRAALAGLGAASAGGFAALWIRAARQGTLSEHNVPGGLAHIDHQLGWTKGVQFGGDFMAQEQGYFARERLDVRYSAGGPGTDYRTIVASGRALVSESNVLGMIEAELQGQPLIAFAAIMQRDPSCIISAADRPILSLHDMVGKTIGLPNNIRGQIMALMRREGIAISSVRFVPVGADPSMLAVRQVDGYFSWSTTAVPALRLAGIEPQVLHMADIGAPGYGGLLITRRDRLEERFDHLVRYTRALIDGWTWMVRNPADTARLVVEKYAEPGISLAEQTIQAELMKSYIEYGDTASKGLLWLRPEIFEENIRLARDTGTIPAGRIIEASHIMTQEVLKAASAKA